MIWLMLVTLSAVFVIGYRVLTSQSRRAVRALCSRLAIQPVYVESLINQIGKEAGEEYVSFLARGEESHLRLAAFTLVIWQAVIVNPDAEHQTKWLRILKRARLDGPISDSQFRQICGFLRTMDPDREEIRLFQQRYNALYNECIAAQSGATWLH